MDAKEVMRQLRAPFKPDEIEWRVGSKTQDNTKGLALAYVTNRAIQDRLDEVFGVFGWRNEFREWKGSSQLCGISVKIDGEWLTKWDGADDSNMEATKGGLSDAMKRAAYQWGIGRYLYRLPDFWVPIKPCGKSYVISQEPKLPSWALPEGFKYDPKATTPKNNFEAVEGAPEAKIKDALNDPNASVIMLCPKCNKPLARTEKEAAAIIDFCNKYKGGDIACRSCQKQK